MTDLRAYASWLVAEAEDQGEEAVAIVTEGDSVIVRYGNVRAAQRLCRRVLSEMERPEGSTLQ